LVRANANEFPTDEEYNNKVNRQWSQKALQGRHPYDLSQQFVDIEASNKWVTKRGFVRRNRGLSNSNTSSSHTEKKIKETYFEAARHR